VGCEFAEFDRVAGVAAHEDDWQFRRKYAEAESEVASAHAGHDDVGNEEIDLLGMFLEAGDRFLGSCCDEDAVAPLDEDRLDQLAQELVVLDHEQGSTGAVSRAGGWW